MDSWYATKKLMAAIEAFGKVYYCPLKTNRLVDDSGGDEPYKRIDQLNWNATEVQRGKLIKVRGFPKDKKVKLFRVIVSTDLLGVCRHQRLDSRLNGRHAKSVCCALEANRSFTARLSK